MPSHEHRRSIRGSQAGNRRVGSLDSRGRVRGVADQCAQRVPAVRLIGTILGAAVPQLITQVGPGHRLRAGMAISVTTLALFAAYGGFTLFAFASDRESVVPLPSIVPQPGDGGGNGSGHAGSGIAVDPDSVDCGDQQVVDELLACEDVTVTSTGIEPLEIWSVTFEPTGSFGQSQTCVEESPLPTGETCTVHVLFRPLGEPGPRAARMSINGNAPSAYVTSKATSKRLKWPETWPCSAWFRARTLPTKLRASADARVRSRLLRVGFSTECDRRLRIAR